MSIRKHKSAFVARGAHVALVHGEMVLGRGGASTSLVHPLLSLAAAHRAWLVHPGLVTEIASAPVLSREYMSRPIQACTARFVVLIHRGATWER